MVSESSLQRDGLYGGLTVAFALALLRGMLGASTTAGRITVAVIFGAVTAIVVTGWIRALTRPDRLQVSRTTICYLSGSGKATPQLDAADGTELRFIAKRAGRVSSLALCQSATAKTLPLRLFARKPIITACESRGWHFS